MYGDNLKKIFVGNLDFEATEESIRTLFEPYGSVDSVALTAPFSGAPVEVAKTEWRFGGLSYTEKGIILLSESDRSTRRNRTWILEAGAQPRKLWERRQQDAYNNPGSPVFKRDGGGGGGFGSRRGSGGPGGRRREPRW